MSNNYCLAYFLLLTPFEENCKVESGLYTLNLWGETMDESLTTVYGLLMLSVFLGFLCCASNAHQMWQRWSAKRPRHRKWREVAELCCCTLFATVLLILTFVMIVTGPTH